jgi:hypothetical protein
MGMQLGFEHITRFKLNGESLNVLLFLISRMDYENYIRVSQKEVAEALGMKKQNVSRAVQILRKFSIIDPGEHNSQRLSLDIGWKGKVANMRKEQTRQELDSTRQWREDEKQRWAVEKNDPCDAKKSEACPTKEPFEIAP